jgi:hypothetical protein
LQGTVSRSMRRAFISIIAGSFRVMTRPRLQLVDGDNVPRHSFTCRDLLQAAFTRCVLAGFDLRGSQSGLLLAPIAGLPDKEYVSRDYRNHDEHPELDLETEKSKMLNQKPHAPRPF